ncbi:MAG: hypothetical protein J7M38_09785, partial [Armatimonadetes bacterium]|nr:hypothetical protein [Armatimonadota bacterium]
MFTRSAVALSLAMFALTAHATPMAANWTREKQEGGRWVPDGAVVAPDAEGSVTFARGKQFFARLSAEVDADLSRTPVLVIDAHASNAQWRLGARAGDGPEIIVADHQIAGVCRRDLGARLGVTGRTKLALHMYIWGWGSGADHYVRFTPELVPAGEETDATVILGEMAAMHRRAAALAEDIS